MRDRREEILARLIVIAKAIPRIRVFHNVENIAETDRPAIVILDADESASQYAQDKGLRNKANNIVTMTPDITILAVNDSDNIGTVMNAYRLKLIKAIFDDSPLAAIVGTNGRIDYLGCDSQFASGRKMNGDMSIRFSFSYPLLTDEL